MKSSNIGGQAVLEGIMMKNEEEYAVAVRKPDGEIEVKVDTYEGVAKKLGEIKKIPFIRGIFSFVDSLVLGMSTLMYSASFWLLSMMSAWRTKRSRRKHLQKRN